MAMYASILVSGPVTTSRWLYLLAFLSLMLYLTGASSSSTEVGQATWFPDKPIQAAYEWHYAPCEHCVPVAPHRDWQKMQQLSGLAKVHFLVSPNDQWGDAYSFAPNAVVLSRAALKLPRCQLDFVIGHELVHLAMHDFDEDAHSVVVLSGVRPSWTRNGKRALSLLDGDYRLALKMSPIWMDQERRADWVGALLSAQGGGCQIRDGALSYLADQRGYGGGIGAAHEDSAARTHFLEGFAEPAARLAARW
jgi:hypothetical protein